MSKCLLSLHKIKSHAVRLLCPKILGAARFVFPTSVSADSSLRGCDAVSLGVLYTGTNI